MSAFPGTQSPDPRKGDIILRNLMRQLLTDDESIRFKLALHNFKMTKSVTTLCNQLKPIINSTEKIMLLLELSTRLPPSIQEDFRRLCSLYYPHYDAYYQIYHTGNAMPQSTKTIAKDSSGNFKIITSSSDSRLYAHFKNNSDQSSIHGTSVTSGIYSEHDDTTSYKHTEVKDNDSDAFVWTPQYGQINANNSTFGTKDNKRNEIKRVFLQRQNGSLGIGIRGGKEYGTDIFVNHVEVGGAAENQGVKVGDRILEVNGTSFSQITHAEAVTAMRNAWNIIMMVQSVSQNGQKQDALHIKEIEMIIFPSATNEFTLGCATTRKQKSKFLKVKGIDRNSPSEKAGLCVGDFIVKIDGIDVRTLSDKQIMSLTRTKRLTLLVKRLVSDDEKILNVRNYRERSKEESTGSQTNIENIDDHESMVTDDFYGDDPEYERVKAIYSNPFSPHTQNGDDISNKVYDTPQRIVYKSEYITAPARGRSEHRNPIQYERRSHSAGKDSMHSQPIILTRPGVRYVRSRSQSPHILRERMPLPRPKRYSKKDLEMITAIQRGMEKRQRAIRLSLYHAASVDDLDWEI